MEFLETFLLLTITFGFTMNSWWVPSPHLDTKMIQYPLQGLETASLDLRLVGGPWGKAGIAGGKNEGHTCVVIVYVTSLSKQGGSARLSDFVVVKICASCAMPNHPTDREVSLFSYLSSCQKTMCRLWCRDKIKYKGSVLPLGIFPSFLLVGGLSTCCPQLLVLVTFSLLVFYTPVLFVIYSAIIIPWWGILKRQTEQGCTSVSYVPRLLLPSLKLCLAKHWCRMTSWHCCYTYQCCRLDHNRISVYAGIIILVR